MEGEIIPVLWERILVLGERILVLEEMAEEWSWHKGG